RRHADGNQDDVALDDTTVGKLDHPHPAARTSLERGRRRLCADVDAVVEVALRETCTELRTEGALERCGAGLNQGDVESALARGRSDLGPDEPAADDHQARARDELAAEPFRGPGRAQDVHALRGVN